MNICLYQNHGKKGLLVTLCKQEDNEVRLMFVCFPFSFSELLGSDGSRKKRHLKDDAVPSVFPYAPPTRKIRQTSVGRANR